ncbi:MarR family winged helix-turn-helix transcriptional regulator [Phaeacidiphilus oryzae]|uniref:MarR family winged helix-turn-helix transcriptional regulator n=1 Tax=Phaeacidiphilus oryzae TaxID=348818 RepID=UPI0009FD9C18|nr:MarR family transcriptional regulator [Phaeacidiphilus oryzae]
MSRATTRQHAANPHDAPDPTEADIAAFQAATRDLVGIALRSLEVTGGQVSLPQLRLLLALDELGRSPSSAIARALGLGASSVTRLADRLVESGHVVRGTEPSHRSVVTLELTERGAGLVGAVLEHRREHFRRALRGLTPAQRKATAEGLRALHAVLAADPEHHSPIAPLSL